MLLVWPNVQAQLRARGLHRPDVGFQCSIVGLQRLDARLQCHISDLQCHKAFLHEYDVNDLVSSLRALLPGFPHGVTRQSAPQKGEPAFDQGCAHPLFEFVHARNEFPRGAYRVEGCKR